MSALTDQITTDAANSIRNINEFAVSAALGAATVYGIFSAPFETTDVFTGAVVNTSAMFLGKASDFLSAARGDSIVIGGTTYYVLEVKSDGIESAIVILSQDSPHG
jgi:hypothetical protein